MAATSHTITSTAATLTIPGGSPIGAKILQISGPVVRFSTGGTTVPPTSNFEMLAVGQLLGEVLGQPGVLHGIPGARILGDVGDLSAKVSPLGSLRTAIGVGPHEYPIFNGPGQNGVFAPGHPFASWALQFTSGVSVPPNLKMVVEYSLDGQGFLQHGPDVVASDFATSNMIVRQGLSVLALQIRVRCILGTFASGAYMKVVAVAI